MSEMSFIGLNMVRDPAECGASVLRVFPLNFNTRSWSSALRFMGRPVARAICAALAIGACSMAALAQNPPATPPTDNGAVVPAQGQPVAPVVVPIPADSAAASGEMVTNEADAAEEAAPPGDSVSPGGVVLAPGSTNGMGQSNEPPRSIVRDTRAWRSRRSRSGQSGSGGFNASNSGNSTNLNPRSMEYFALISQRNIFNPNRYPYVPGARPEQPQIVRPPRETFTLVGTMSYEKGDYAIFAGSSSAYNTALKPADRIAGYKIIAVTPDSVKLAQQTNVLELKLGMQMRREEDGPWRLGNGSSAYAAGAEPAATALDTSSTASDPASASGADSDIIKRMMQRREQE